MTSRPKPPVPRVNPCVPHFANTTPPLPSDLQPPCGLPCETVFHPIPAPAARSRPFSTAPHALPTPPQQTPFQIAQGKHKNNASGSLMQPQPWVRGHPFVPTLEEWETGVPVDCGPDWTLASIEAAIVKGNHTSAMTPESIQLVHDDVAYQVAAGFCQVVAWDTLRTHLPSSLKVSPLAVIPQRDRRGRIILDLSFDVRQPLPKPTRCMGPIIQDSVNKTSTIIVPEGPVKAIGGGTPQAIYHDGYNS